MRKDYEPSEIWIDYGLSDLYFAHINQGNDVYRYGTFFFIMAAEKHLKAALIHNGLSSKPHLKSKEDRRSEADNIAKNYSHNFEKMITDVSLLYETGFDGPFVPDTYLTFEKSSLIKAMYEGYMETRYPTVTSSSRHFPYKKSGGVYHSPIGSSFFTDFTELICHKSWSYLEKQGVVGERSINLLYEKFGQSENYNVFKALYVDKLPQ